MKNYAIILAGGNGSRMNSTIPKQYLEINGKTVLYYSIKQFEDCPFIDEIILVTRKEDIEYCKKKYIFSKLKNIVPGGKERYDSVMNGLALIEEDGYVYVHDGARPCITQEMLYKLDQDVKKYNATVLAVVTKDTIRITDDNDFAISTPIRSHVWQIQTPQVFNTSLLKKAYTRMITDGTDKAITDDAMVVEEFTDVKIHMTKGEYSNIKITTNEDLWAIEIFLKKM